MKYLKLYLILVIVLFATSSSAQLVTPKFEANDIADGDHGDFTYSTGAATLDIDVVAPAEMADADHGDFTYSSGSATLDTDTVAPAEMADADHGDISWSSGVASVDANSVALTTDTTGNYAASNAEAGPATSVEFEGATADAFETTLAVTDPTADRTVTFPDNDMDFGLRAVNVKDFGAVCDGATDDKTAIQAALDSGAGIVELPGGAVTCLSDSEIVIPSGVIFRGQGIGESILSCAGALGSFTNLGCISSSGSISVVSAPNGNIAANATAVVFDADVSGSLAQGDILIIQDATNSSYTGFRTGYKEGEYLTVFSVSTVTATLASPIRANAGYTDGANLKTWELNGNTIQIRDMSIIGLGTGTTNSLRILYGRDVILKNLNITGSAETEIAFEHCFHCTISNVTVNMWINGASVTDYGLVISNSQDVIISDSFFRAARHGVTVGGAAGGDADVVNRNIMIDNCEIRTITTASPHAPAMDLHGNVEYATIQNSIFEQGIFGGNKTKWIDNTIIVVDTTAGRGMEGAELSGFDHEFIGNTVWNQTAIASTTSPFLQIAGSGDLTSNTVLGGTLVISDNTVHTEGDTDNKRVILVENAGFTGGNLSIVVKNNRFLGALGGSNWYLEIKVDSGDPFYLIDIDGNLFQGFGLEIRSSPHRLRVTNNHFDEPGHIGMEIQVGTTTVQPQYWLIQNNFMHGTNIRSMRLLGDATDPTPELITIKGNILVDNLAATGSDASLDSVIQIDGNTQLFNTVIVRDNVFGCYDCTGTGGEQQRPATFDQIANLVQSGNLFFGTGEPTYSNVGGRSFDKLRQLRTIPLHAAAATFNVGADIPAGSVILSTAIRADLAITGATADRFGLGDNTCTDPDKYSETTTLTANSKDADTHAYTVLGSAENLMICAMTDASTAGGTIGGEATAPAACIQDDNGVFTDDTTDCGDAGNADFAIIPATATTDDHGLIGHGTKFNEVTFDYANGTAGVGGTHTWEYWNGSVWATLATTADTTTTLTATAADGLVVQFVLPNDWATTTINSQGPYYYIRTASSGAYTTSPVLDQVFVGGELITIEVYYTNGTVGLPDL